MDALTKDHASEAFLLTVNTVSGKQTRIQVQPETTVWEAKGKVEEALGHSRKAQRWVYAIRVLGNSELLGPLQDGGVSGSGSVEVLCVMLPQIIITVIVVAWSPDTVSQHLGQLELLVSIDTPVSQVREDAAEHFAVPGKRVFAVERDGRRLEAQRCLGFYGVEDGAKLYMLARPRPSSSKSAQPSTASSSNLRPRAASMSAPPPPPKPEQSPPAVHFGGRASDRKGVLPPLGVPGWKRPPGAGAGTALASLPISRSA